MSLKCGFIFLQNSGEMAPKRNIGKQHAYPGHVDPHRTRSVTGSVSRKSKRTLFCISSRWTVVVCGVLSLSSCCYSCCAAIAICVDYEILPLILHTDDCDDSCVVTILSSCCYWSWVWYIAPYSASWTTAVRNNWNEVGYLPAALSRCTLLKMTSSQLDKLNIGFYV